MPKKRRRPPDVHAEMAMLGGMILRPNEIDDVRKIVSTSMLTVGMHRELFDTLRWLRDHRGCVDATAVVEEMRDRGHPHCAAFLANIVQSIDHEHGSIAYAYVVQRRSGMGPLNGEELAKDGR